MTITIKIDTGNEAFQDGNREAEIERILKGWIDRNGFCGTVPLHDVNGNHVGSVTVKGK